VVLNPVRAEMVKDMEDWSWSSHRSMIGKSAPPDWSETGWLLTCFSKQRKRAIAKYIDFVRAVIGLPVYFTKSRVFDWWFFISLYVSKLRSKRIYSGLWLFWYTDI
jgi:hypothetical protein